MLLLCGKAILHCLTFTLILPLSSPLMKSGADTSKGGGALKAESKIMKMVTKPFFIVIILKEKKVSEFCKNISGK